MSKVTPRTIKWLLTDIWPTYERTSIDKTKSLVDFIRSDVLKDLIGLARRKFRGAVYANATDAEMPRLLSDHDVEFLLCVTVKPNSINEYQRSMLENVERMPSKLTWDFGLRDYDTNMTLRVEKVIDDVKHFDEYFRRGAEHNAPSCCPPMQWGKHGNIGVFNIAIECFGQYKDNFKSMLSLDFLSSCRDMAKFVSKVRELNNKYTQLSEEHRINDELTRPTEKLETSILQISTKDMQRRFVDGKVERRTTESAAVASGGQERTFKDERQFFTREKEKFLPEIPSSDGATFHRLDGGHTPLRSAVLTVDNRLHLVELPKKAALQARLNVMQKEPFRPTPPPKPKFSPHFNSPTDSKGKLDAPFVCYHFAMTGSCPRGKECPFSHDENMARRWVQSKIRMYTESPFLKHSEMQMSLIQEDLEYAEMFRIQAREEEDDSEDSEASEDAEDEEPRLSTFQATGPPGCIQLSTKPKYKR